MGQRAHFPSPRPGDLCGSALRLPMTHLVEDGPVLVTLSDISTAGFDGGTVERSTAQDVKY